MKTNLGDRHGLAETKADSYEAVGCLNLNRSPNLFMNEQREWLDGERELNELLGNVECGNVMPSKEIYELLKLKKGVEK